MTEKDRAARRAAKSLLLAANHLADYLTLANAQRLSARERRLCARCAKLGLRILDAADGLKETTKRQA